jgi:heme o synthase
MGNLITTGAGFALASKGQLDWLLFLALLIGLGTVIASACVFNNYIDRDLDKKMKRTSSRALAKGLISNKRALLFACVLGLVGFMVLGLYTNLLATFLAGLAFFVYVGLYSFWKARTQWATLVGSISGAMPPVIGYCAVSSRLDMGALLLFLILVFWQMPHFFSIAMFRLGDYSKANVPVLPVEKGSFVTKVHMLLYIFAFLISLVLLPVFGFTGYLYLMIALPLALSWAFLCVKGFRVENDQIWARQMFRLSLVVVMALSIMISIDA